MKVRCYSRKGKRTRTKVEIDRAEIVEIAKVAARIVAYNAKKIAIIKKLFNTTTE